MDNSVQGKERVLPFGVVAVRDPAEGAGKALAECLQEILEARVPLADDPLLCQGYPILVGGTEAVAAGRAFGINVEKDAWDPLSEEGFLIRSSDRILLIAGKTELSLFYAVEQFLEKHLGVRWFLPDEIGEEVPSSPTVKIGRIDEVGEPGFAWRWVGRGEWARRNGMNVGVDSPG